jgi:hypothetical protein
MFFLYDAQLSHKYVRTYIHIFKQAATMSDGGAVQILGPLLKNNEAHCKALPYYEVGA